MGQSRILQYSEKWKSPLKMYMKRTFPTYSEAYIDYCLSHSSGDVSSLLAINNKDEVIGCHLYYCTKAIINGEQIATQWGHDTFLDEKYRKEIGVDFLLARKKIPAFGVGLTETNAKMRKLMKSVFLNGVYNYYTITLSVLITPFQKFFKLDSKIKEVESIRVKGKVFKRVYSSKEINIPNEGFWYKGINDLDFIRDRDFLDYRFFYNRVHDYKVYASDDSYFVIRTASYRGFPALLLSDFRYNAADSESASKLLKAVFKIAEKSCLGIVFFVCGDRNIDVLIKRRIHYKTHLDFITSYNISPDATCSLSGGDSDAEFLKH